MRQKLSFCVKCDKFIALETSAIAGKQEVTEMAGGVQGREWDYGGEDAASGTVIPSFD